MASVLAAACSSDGAPNDAQRQEETAPRSFEMGLSSVPEEPSKAGYEKVFGLAGENGDLILIQRAPPWEEFRPGGAISAETVDLAAEEKRLAEANGLQIFAAVDPLDPADRGRLASPPEDLAGAGFGDPKVRSAFIAYAQYLALNLKPRYMALGMDVDLYEAARPDDFDNFVSLYFDAYDAVKDISPETLVFPTFQMEAIQNLLSPPMAPPTGRLPRGASSASDPPRNPSMLPQHDHGSQFTDGYSATPNVRSEPQSDRTNGGRIAPRPATRRRYAVLIVISTRRFCWRPSGSSLPSSFSLGTAGLASPQPVVSMRPPSAPAFRTSQSLTEFARRSDRS